MAESNLHYLFVVRAPGIGLNMLRAGAWVIMANEADVAAFDDRKSLVIQALTAFRGQVAVFQLPLDNPEGAVVVWAHNVDRPPELGRALTPTPEQRDIFWAYVAFHHQRQTTQSALAAAAPAVASAPEEKTRGRHLKWWLIGAALIVGLIAYAIVPEIFRDFNWQGRQYYSPN